MSFFPPKNRYYSLGLKLPLFLLILVHLFILAKTSFTAWPEMILWPYFLLKGLLPYRDIAMAHNPLLIFDLAFFYKIFGVSLLSLKIYSWLLVIITDFMLFFVAKKFIRNSKTTLLVLAFYVFWQPYFEGNGVWFDLVLAPLAILIFYSLHQKKLFLAGVLTGLSILTKQTAFLFLVPIFFTIWFLFEKKLKTIKEFLFGLTLPFVLFFAWLFYQGIITDYYFWGVKFGSFYLPKSSGQIQLPTIKQLLSLSVPYAFVFLSILTFIVNRARNGEEKRKIILLIIWCFFTALGVYPRFGLFHFQPSLPFLALISGIMISESSLWFKKHKKAPLLIFLVFIIGGSLYLQGRFYWLHWRKPDRFFEKETLEAASWLTKNTKRDEKIFILNSWDHLYALSGTLPAVSPWVPTLPWYLEYDKIQDGVVADLEVVKPNLIVFEPYRREGLGSYKPEMINRFLVENYELTKIVAGRFWIFVPK